MLFSRIVRVAAIVAGLAVAGWLLAQSQLPSKQYVVLLKRGPKWVPGKPAGEQALGNHGRYLQEQMTKGALQLAGPFLDDSGGLILYNAGERGGGAGDRGTRSRGGGWDPGGGVDPAVSAGLRRREREEPVQRGEVIAGDGERSVSPENPLWSGAIVAFHCQVYGSDSRNRASGPGIGMARAAGLPLLALAVTCAYFVAAYFPAD